jgi:CubicO group peptidase (beta-lactamase class C family)
MRFYDFLSAEIFQPLEMADTCFVVSSERMHHVMPCYEVSAGASFVESSSSKYDVQSGDCLQGGGAGLVSSMRDLSRFARCLCEDTFYSSGKRLLSEDLTKLISTNCLLNSSNMPATLLEMSFNTGFSESIGDGIGFGLGVYVLINPSTAKGGSLSSIGEFGWGGVASTWMMIDPDQRLTLTFMTQLVPSSSYPIRSQLGWLCHFITQNQS